MPTNRDISSDGGFSIRYLREQDKSLHDNPPSRTKADLGPKKKKRKKKPDKPPPPPPPIIMKGKS